MSSTSGREIHKFRREMTAKFRFSACRGAAKFAVFYRDKQMPLIIGDRWIVDLKFVSCRSLLGALRAPDI